MYSTCSEWEALSWWEPHGSMGGSPATLIPPDGKTINTYFPSELLREIFLYSIESNQIKSGILASVCRYWRTVITELSHLWSTLRVGTWTEREQVATWLHRAYPKKVVIDTQEDNQTLSNTPFAALQDALATNQWHELTISSFPPENLASQLSFQFACPMNALKVLHVAAGCVETPSFAHMLSLVPTKAPLSELGLHSSFAITHFLQSPWSPVLQNLTALVVNGKDYHEPFALLPTFNQLLILEVDHLSLPFYGSNTDLPLLRTLQKLQLRACSVQWMVGREFRCLEECAIRGPHHWRELRLYGVRLPSCRKLTYHGYPMTTAQYFHVPQMKEMELGSHDCSEHRVYKHLHHLCTLDERVSKLTMLHLTLQCSEQVFFKVLKFLGPLQELVLSIAYPSTLWQGFLDSLTAKPSTKDWPTYWAHSWTEDHPWVQWCESPNWHANILPHLKHLGIKCPKGFSQSECLDNSPLLRLVGWTRAQLTPPLEHLKVWEGKGTTDDIVVDYISTGYLDKSPGMSGEFYEFYDSMVVRGMVTQCLSIDETATQLFQLHSTILFRQIQELEVDCSPDYEILILPYLEQIKRLTILHGIIPEHPISTHLPLVRTLQWLRLGNSEFSWMLRRSFRALREFYIDGPRDTPEKQSRVDGLQADLPACTTLKVGNISVTHLHFFSCKNVQILQIQYPRVRHTIHEAVFKPLVDFLCDRPCLKTFGITISKDLELGSLIHLVFCNAREQGVWPDIRSVEVKVTFTGGLKDDAYRFFNQTVGHQQNYEKWWKEFTVTMGDAFMVIVKASR